MHEVQKISNSCLLPGRETIWAKNLTLALWLAPLPLFPIPIPFHFRGSLLGLVWCSPGAGKEWKLHLVRCLSMLCSGCRRAVVAKFPLFKKYLLFFKVFHTAKMMVMMMEEGGRGSRMKTNSSRAYQDGKFVHGSRHITRGRGKERDREKVVLLECSCRSSGNLLF